MYWYGGSTGDPSGLLSSRAMPDLVAELIRNFDLIVLDTAPALALAETRVTARLADCVLLVARWRTTPTGAVQLASSLLTRAGAPVTAVALTRIGA